MCAPLQIILATKLNNKELRFCFHMTEQNLITALPTPQMCFHWTDSWGLFVQNSHNNLRDQSTDNSQTVLGHKH